jgi:hypothetical protein
MAPPLPVTRPLWSSHLVPKETYVNIQGDICLPRKMVLTMLASLTLCCKELDLSGCLNLIHPFKLYCAEHVTVKAAQSSGKEEFTHNVRKIFWYDK